MISGAAVKNVDGKLQGLTIEIKNINNVSGYDKMLDNLKLIKGANK